MCPSSSKRFECAKLHSGKADGLKISLDEINEDVAHQASSAVGVNQLQLIFIEGTLLRRQIIMCDGLVGECEFMNNVGLLVIVVAIPNDTMGHQEHW